MTSTALMARIPVAERLAHEPGKLLCPLCGADQGYMTGSDAEHVRERARWRCEVCRDEFPCEVDLCVTYYTRRPEKAP